jgi:hypothetical protein
MSKPRSVEGKGTSGMLCIVMHSAELDGIVVAVGKTADTISNFMHALNIIFWHNLKIPFLCHHKLHYR